MPDVPALDAIQRAFLGVARTATLATIRPDGLPRLVPICFIVGEDDADGRPTLSSPLDEKPKASADPRALARVRDLIARPEATLLVDRWSEDWSRLGWVRLEARATLIDPGTPGHAHAVGALRVKYPQYLGHALEMRPVLHFTIQRAVAWGDLGPDGQSAPPGSGA